MKVEKVYYLSSITLSQGKWEIYVNYRDPRDNFVNVQYDNKLLFRTEWDVDRYHRFLLKHHRLELDNLSQPLVAPRVKVEEYVK